MRVFSGIWIFSVCLGLRLYPSLFTLLVVVCLYRLALLIQVSPSYTASACHWQRMLSLFTFPASFGVTVPVILFAPSVFCAVSPFLNGILLFSYISLSFACLYGGFFIRGFSVHFDCLRSAWGPSASFTASTFLLVYTYVSFSFDPQCFCQTISFLPLIYPLVITSRVFQHLLFPLSFLISPHVLFFPSLAMLGLSARLHFPHFSYSVLGSLSSFYPSCSSLPFHSFSALLTRSNLRFPPRRGPPFGPGQFPIGFLALFFGWLSFACPS